MKRILLLGATGSIGQQTLDVIRQHSDQFELVGVCAGTQSHLLKTIVEDFPSVQVVGLSCKDDTCFPHRKVYYGDNSMVDCIQNCEYDLLVNAVVGFRGLRPTLASLEKGKDVALANKESLVAGGVLVRKALKKTGTHLYPIDSEHSAIFQCLQGARKQEVQRLIITASGGSFRNKTRAQLQDVTVEQALAHPNWAMGKRITIDSATMVNKGFEVIEAHFLFDLEYEQIDTVLHAQSLIHSMVEFKDHAILAQLGSADMRLPIQYALMYPHRSYLHEEHPLDMTKTMILDFKEMDYERYPMLKLAYQIGKKEGNLGACFNGADEQAVSLFLDRKISFLQIEESIQKALEAVEYQSDPNLEDLERTDRFARDFVLDYWGLEK